MRWSRGRVFFLVAIAAVYFGWQHLSRDAYETVILHVPPSTRSQDTYVNVWIVEDGQQTWLRAESQERLWLQYLDDAPFVEIDRGGHVERYLAVTERAPRIRAHVDALFREKYGLADEARALLRGDTVPIRLVRP